MGNYRLDLAYVGTDFHGYATQPNVRTVQDDLEAALRRVVGPVDTVVAGRTDKGVHATGQVVSFRTDYEIDCPRLARSLNTQLRPAVAVLSLTEAPADFHARFSATGRAYRYVVLNREAPDPFLAATAYHYRTALDAGAMKEGCQVLIGIHDFASFCRAAPGRSTERDLRVVEWEEHTNGVKELYIAGSSFCHQMVRSIVAVSLDIGRGRLAPNAMGEILEARDRSAGCGASPAHGLTLVAVEYE
jgi:tRNA pseudouridine38-40 synthase